MIDQRSESADSSVTRVQIQTETTWTLIIIRVSIEEDVESDLTDLTFRPSSLVFTSHSCVFNTFRDSVQHLFLRLSGTWSVVSSRFHVFLIFSQLVCEIKPHCLRWLLWCRCFTSVVGQHSHLCDSDETTDRFTADSETAELFSC